MTQPTGPEFKGGIHPLFNTAGTHPQTPIDPEDIPDFLNPVSRRESSVIENSSVPQTDKKDALIDPDFTHLKSKIDRRPKSIVSPGDPDFIDPNVAATEASERAWDALEAKKKERKNEIQNIQPGVARDALSVVRASDSEVEGLLDSLYPVAANRIVAHEAQISLSQQSTAPAPQQR